MQGMPRRYHVYPEEFSLLHQISTSGTLLLTVGYFFPLFYLGYSFFKAPRAERNPWQAPGLEWTIDSPPDEENFSQSPRVTLGPYDFAPPVLTTSPEENQQ